jgi:effector-binding domain-containing protein
MSELPAGRVAMMWYFGPYRRLAQARTQLRDWITKQHLVPRGGPIEIYWTDPALEPDPTKWRTQLLWPIE